MYLPFHQILSTLVQPSRHPSIQLKSTHKSLADLLPCHIRPSRRPALIERARMFACEPYLSPHTHALSQAPHISRRIRDWHLEINVAPIASQLIELPSCVQDPSWAAGSGGRRVVGKERDVRSEEGVKRVSCSGA